MLVVDYWRVSSWNGPLPFYFVASHTDSSFPAGIGPFLAGLVIAWYHSNWNRFKFPIAITCKANRHFTSNSLFADSNTTSHTTSSTKCSYSNRSHLLSFSEQAYSTLPKPRRSSPLMNGNCYPRMIRYQRGYTSGWIWALARSVDQADHWQKGKRGGDWCRYWQIGDCRSNRWYGEKQVDWNQ